MRLRRGELIKPFTILFQEKGGDPHKSFLEGKQRNNQWIINYRDHLDHSQSFFFPDD